MIEVRELSKYYSVHRRSAGLWAALRSVARRPRETVKAVDRISFSIGDGETVGFLGPNGAGKTTTLKVLAGLLHATSGEARVAGLIPYQRRPEFLKQITLVMGQKQQLIWDLPPVDTFEMNRAIYEIPPDRFRETLAELDTLLDLGKISRVPTRQLSLGERMKCELAAALLHRPRVLFLDEPTIGLDVSMQAVLRGFVRAYNQRFGATVLLTSHYMEDVVALCPRVLVIDRGHLRYDGQLAELSHSLRPEKLIRLRFSRSVPAGDLARFGVLVARQEDGALFKIQHPELRDTVARMLAELPVSDLTVEDPPIEDVMRDLFSHHEAAAS